MGPDTSGHDGARARRAWGGPQQRRCPCHDRRAGPPTETHLRWPCGTEDTDSGVPLYCARPRAVRAPNGLGHPSGTHVGPAHARCCPQLDCIAPHRCQPSACATWPSSVEVQAVVGPRLRDSLAAALRRRHPPPARNTPLAVGELQPCTLTDLSFVHQHPHSIHAAGPWASQLARSERRELADDDDRTGGAPDPSRSPTRCFCSRWALSGRRRGRGLRRWRGSGVVAAGRGTARTPSDAASPKPPPRPAHARHQGPRLPPAREALPAICHRPEFPFHPVHSAARVTPPDTTLITAI